MQIVPFNITATQGHYSFFGILQGANAATGQIFAIVMLLVLYFIFFYVFRERIADMRNAALAVCTIMLFLTLFLFWMQFVNQVVLTFSIVFFAGSLIMAIWRGDN